MPGMLKFAISVASLMSSLKKVERYAGSLLAASL